MSSRAPLSSTADKAVDPLDAALRRIAELEEQALTHRVTLDNLHLHKAELLAQNDELRQAQANLEAARLRHQALFDFSPVAHFLVSVNGMILKTNREAARLIGIDAQALYGFHMPNLTGDSQQRVAMLNFLEALRDGEPPSPLALGLFHRDGGQTRVQLHGSRSGGHNETSLLLTAVALYPRTGETAAVVENERLLGSTVFEQCAQPLLITDAALHVIRCNPAFLRFSGYAPREVLGHLLEAVIADELEEATAWLMWRSLQDQGHWEGIARLRKRNGERHELPVRVDAVAAQDERVTHYVCSLECLSPG
ncbi:MAG: PAS domain-containing protein [Pseudomonadota bacterium]